MEHDSPPRKVEVTDSGKPETEGLVQVEELAVASCENPLRGGDVFAAHPLDFYNIYGSMLVHASKLARKKRTQCILLPILLAYYTRLYANATPPI